MSNINVSLEMHLNGQRVLSWNMRYRVEIHERHMLF
jgi:hypothetical protein